MQYIILVAIILWGLYKAAESHNSSVPVKKPAIPVQPVVPVKKVADIIKYKPEFGDWLWTHNNPGVNIALGAVRKVPEWFIDKWVKDIPVSPAEQLIINELEKYNIEWHREVSFTCMSKTEKGANYRFDFYLPSQCMIVEYDSKAWHNDPTRIAVDRIKDKFCKDNCIRIIRYDSSHYHHITFHIEELMEEIGALKAAVAS